MNLKLTFLFFISALLTMLSVRANEGMIYYNSFDNPGFKPDIAKGSKAVRCGQPENIKTVSGVTGKAVVLGDNGQQRTWLEFMRPGNLELSEGTVSMWIKPMDWDGKTKGFGFFFKAGNPDNSGFMLYKYMSPGFMRFLSGRRHLKEAKTELLWLSRQFKDWQKGQWHHVVVSWRQGGKTFIGKEGRIRFFIDGKPGVSKLCDEKYFPENLPPVFFIGASTRWGSSQIGFTAYDDLKIFSRELSDEEIRKEYLSFKQNERVNNVFSAPRVTTPPVIDGTMDSGEWKQASSYDIFYNRRGNYAGQLNQPEVKIAFDREKIYIGTREYIGQAALKTTAKGHDAAVYLDDAYEFFIGKTRDGNDYRHYAVNSAGAVYDGIAMNSKWNGKAEFRSQVKDGWWTIEAAIPASDIELPEFKTGELSFNLCRTYMGREGRTFFSIGDVRGSFHNPKLFAALQLLGNDQAVKVNMLNPFSTNMIKVQFSAPAGFGITSGIYLNGKDIDNITKQFSAGDITQELILKRSSSFQQYRLSPEIKTGSGMTVYRQQAIINLSPRMMISSTMNPENGKVIFNFQPATIETAKQLEGGKIQFSFSVPGGNDRTFSLPFKRSLAVDNQNLPEQSCLLKCAFFSQNGKELFQSTYDYYRIDYDKWKNYQGGLDDNVVPSPWSPVSCRNQTLMCWNREYVLGKYSLPEQIKVGGTNILRPGGVKLNAVINGRSVTISDFKLTPTEELKGKITLRGKGEFDGVKVTATLVFEFDGYCVADFAISRGQADISRLTLEFPFTKETAQLKFVPFLNERPVQKDYIGAVTDYFAVRFRPGIWIGNDDYGLTWFAESDQFWYPASRDSAIELVKDKAGDATLRLNLIRKANALPAELRYKFGFQATPVKPMPAAKDWLGYSFVEAPNNKIYITGWGNRLNHNHQGFPGNDGCIYGKEYQEKGFQQARELQSGKNRYNTKLLAVRYLNPTMCADTVPEFKAFKKYWAVIPFDIWGTDAPDSVPFYRVSPDSQSWGNFYCYKFNQYFKRSTENGMYQDFGHPILDSNPLHGSGYVKDGKRYPTYSIFKYHELNKRLYRLAMQYESAERPIFFIGHSGGSYCLPHGNFWQMVVDGEYFGGVIGKTQPYLDFLNPDRMRAEMSGKQFGVIFNFIPVRGGYTDKDDNSKYTEELMAALVPHAVLWGWHAFINRKVQYKVLGAYKRFGFTGIEEFLPYWKNSDYITCSDAKVHCSLLVKPGKVLVNIGNFSKQAEKATLRLNLKKLGYDAGQVSMIDAITGNPVEISFGGEVKLDISGRSFAMLLLQRK